MSERPLTAAGPAPWVGWFFEADEHGRKVWNEVLWGGSYQEVLTRLEAVTGGDLADLPAEAGFREATSPANCRILREQGALSAKNLLPTMDATWYTIYKALHLLEVDGLVRQASRTCSGLCRRPVVIWEAVVETAATGGGTIQS
jgi:hypothetical protein